MPSAQPTESARSELVDQIVAGKLGVSAACSRYGVDKELLIDGLRAFRRSAVLAFDEQVRQRLIGQGVPASLWRDVEGREGLRIISGYVTSRSAHRPKPL